MRRRLLDLLGPRWTFFMTFFNILVAASLLKDPARSRLIWDSSGDTITGWGLSCIISIYRFNIDSDCKLSNISPGPSLNDKMKGKGAQETNQNRLGN